MIKFYKYIILYLVAMGGLQLHAQPAKMVVQSGHFDEILCLEFSPNGQYLASGGKDRQVVLYDVKTGLQMDVYKGHKTWVNAVGFSADNRYVIALSGSTVHPQSEVKVWDIASGDSVYTIHETTCGDIESFRMSSDGKWLVLKVDGMSCTQFQVYALESGKQEHSWNLTEDLNEFWQLSPDGKTIVCEDEEKGNMIVLDLLTGQIRGKYHVQELKELYTRGRQVSCFSNDSRFYHRGFGFDTWVRLDVSNGNLARNTFDLPSASSPSDYHVGPDKTVLFSNEGDRIGFYSLPNVQRTGEIELSGCYATVSAVLPSRNLIAVADKQNVWFVDLRSGKTIRQFLGTPCKPTYACFSNNSNQVAIADYYTPLKIWNLQSADAVKIFTGIDDAKYEETMRFSPDDKVLFSYGENPRLVHVPTLEHKRFNEHFYYRMHVRSGSSGGFHTVDNSFSKIMIGQRQYELSSGKPDCDYGPGERYYKRYYTGNAKYAYGYTHEHEHDSLKVFVFNTEDCSPLTVYKVPDHGRWGHVSVSANAEMLAVVGRHVAVVDFRTGRMLTELRGDALEKEIKSFTKKLDCSALDFSPDGKQIAIADQTSKKIAIFSMQENRFIKILEGHDDEIYSLHYSPDGSKIITVANDKQIILWDSKSGERLATFVPAGELDYAVYTPDNFYMTSKNGLQAVAFRVGNKMFRAEQFDLRQNRPDTVLYRIGSATRFSIKMYNQAWKKRLKRAGFAESMLGSDYDIPVVTVKHAYDLPAITHDSVLALQVSFRDSLYFLDRYNVYVNDVPLFGKNGLSIRKKQLKALDTQIGVLLARGKNRIEISVYNEKGTESMREAYEVILSGDNESEPDLYILAVGAGNYLDKSRDLKFATKDATDLTRWFQTNSAGYNKVNVLLITGAEAVNKNILAGRTFLANARVNDRVVLYFSGHGLLDDRLNYYLATYNVDFANPSIGGLPYEQFEGLIDSIPCRNRLVLIDACHSGEVDKEDTEVLAANTARDVTQGARSGGVKIKPRAGLRNSFALMQEMFADVHKGTGATVISAAGGMEYALESKDWNNGVFTYALLEGMQTYHADLDLNRTIRVTELRQYVSNKVYELTRGAQLPTARRENTLNDFIIH